MNKWTTLFLITLGFTIGMGCSDSELSPAHDDDDNDDVSDDDVADDDISDDDTGDDDISDDDTTECVDEDGDGSCVEDDCDDNDPNNFPGNIEYCDGVDNNCDDVEEAKIGTLYQGLIFIYNDLIMFTGPNSEISNLEGLHIVRWEMGDLGASEIFQQNTDCQAVADNVPPGGTLTVATATEDGDECEAIWEVDYFNWDSSGATPMCSLDF